MSLEVSAADWNALLGATVESAYDSVVVTDTDFRIVYVNPAFTQLTGYGSDEAIGATPGILQGKDTDPDVLERLRNAIDNNEAFEGSTVNYRKDGSAFDIQWKVIPVAPSGGAITHYVTVQRDVSS